MSTTTGYWNGLITTLCFPTGSWNDHVYEPSGDKNDLRDRLSRGVGADLGVRQGRGLDDRPVGSGRDLDAGADLSVDLHHKGHLVALQSLRGCFRPARRENGPRPAQKGPGALRGVRRERRQEAGANVHALLHFGIGPISATIKVLLKCVHKLHHPAYRGVQVQPVHVGQHLGRELVNPASELTPWAGRCPGRMLSAGPGGLSAAGSCDILDELPVTL